MRQGRSALARRRLSGYPRRMILTTTMSSKGHIIIPRKVREDLGLEPGVRLEVTQQAGSLTLRPCTSGTASLEEVAGCLPVKGPARSVVDMNWAVDSLFVQGYSKMCIARTHRGT